MATHIENLKIDTYRGIRDLEINHLGHVNILVGDNNSGKTSVLEAVQILCEPHFGTLVEILNNRNIGETRLDLSKNESFKDSLFYLSDYNQKKHFHIKLSGKIKKEMKKIEVYLKNNRKDMSFKVDDSETEFAISKDSLLDLFHLETVVVAKFIHVIDHLIKDPFKNLIERKSVKDKAIELLTYFDETIQDIRYIKKEHHYTPVIENVADDYTPLSIYGDGMKKALLLLNALIESENGVVLIDEFETSLHTSAMESVFRFMMKVAKELNIQLFLTTHSIEAVDKLLQCAETDIDEIRIIRLRKKENKTYASVIKGQEALNERKAYEMELRV